MRIEHTRDGTTASQPGLKPAPTTRPDPPPYHAHFITLTCVTQVFLHIDFSEKVVYNPVGIDFDSAATTLEKV